MRKAFLGAAMLLLLASAAWAETDVWDEWYEDETPAVTSQDEEPAGPTISLDEGQVIGPMWGVPEDAAWWQEYARARGARSQSVDRSTPEAREYIPRDTLYYYYGGGSGDSHDRGQVYGPMWGVPPEAVGLEYYYPYYPYVVQPEQPKEEAAEPKPEPEADMWYE